MTPPSMNISLQMNPIIIIFKREFLGYFRSPVAYVFLAAFLVAAVGLPWFLGNFFDNGEASLTAFFDFIPWIFLILIPAAGMRLWAEERRMRTWELLFTMPLSITQAVIGKFLAGWAFLSIAILMTLTMPATLAYLGDPDWGPVITGYIGTLLMAGAYLGICSLASSLTQNQVISFVISLIVLMLLVFLGWSVFNDFLLSIGFGIGAVDALANFSFITHFEPMKNGLITLADVTFYISLMAACLGLNVLILER